ncbi:MAG TPA: NUMOD4 motif-containing HNH endonuclease [Chitinophagaceae bacterium]|nr:NUMOD4 motif-containing HNH endonuclease [Chitinophagaceae bacterium]
MTNVQEIWKQINGYEGYYEVSNLGRVKSLNRVVYRGLNEMNISEKILNPSSLKNGYLYVSLASQSGIKKHLVHRLVATAFLSNSENKYCVNHIDGIKTNNVLLNLEWATHTENSAHAKNKGLAKWATGSKAGKSKKIINKATGVVYNSIREAAQIEGYNEKYLANHLRVVKNKKIKLSYQ